ncbi:MAG: nicotinate phosphoribosyltransferase [Frankiaceae bacterium]|nr:nicotinate phosphoribosyltransferase [Frankiaceae bacterium]
MQFSDEAPGTAGSAMLTDRYELTMLSSWLREGTADNRAVFECFARRLPAGRRYGVVAGIGRLLPLIRDFRFDHAEIAYLLAAGAITDPAADYLRGFAFSGTVAAYAEGDLYFPNSPLLTVTGTLAEACLLETLILSVLNHDSAIASAASRMVVAARGRPLIDMGSRRAHENAAVACARAAYLAGFASTSNLAAGFLYGVPTTGTAAHAFTLSHRTEREAFASQIAALGPQTTLLVDTFDTAQGIRTAIDVAGANLGGIRLDSGDLDIEARNARALLDSLGATSTRITVTSDLDEYVIAALAESPIDGFGVGTRLVTGSGHPTSAMVYKLVAVADSSALDAPLRDVAKSSPGKVGMGGHKSAYRIIDSEGHAVGERIVSHGEPAVPGARLLTHDVMRGGRALALPTLDESRGFHARALAELPREHLAITGGDPALTAAR